MLTSDFLENLNLLKKFNYFICFIQPQYNKNQDNFIKIESIKADLYSIFNEITFGIENIFTNNSKSKSSIKNILKKAQEIEDCRQTDIIKDLTLIEIFFKNCSELENVKNIDFKIIETAQREAAEIIFTKLQ